MTHQQEWHPVLRIVWCAGGIVAVNGPGRVVEIKVGINGRAIYSFKIDTYPSLFVALQQRGFLILGTTFVLDKNELDGLRPPEFRAMGFRPGWATCDAKQQWREIGFAAGRTGQMPLMDIASRIASSLKYSQMRLRDLVSAYSTQLNARLHNDSVKDYAAFDDLNSPEVYKGIHALFWEMAILRDVLAEFIAKICLQRTGVRTMRGLCKSLCNSSSPDTLATKILAATNLSTPKGWIAAFTEYRNCFTHAAPMEQAAGVAFAVQDIRNLSCGLRVPQIYYPLPYNVMEIERKRSQGIFPNSLEELVSTARQRHERHREPDALEFLHQCIAKFADLSLCLVARSPITPEPIQITEKDIIGKIRYTYS